MPTAIITGANRGLGHALAEAFVGAGWRVHACARHPERCDRLKSMGVDMHRLDVTDALQVASLSRSLAGEPVDLLLNNAGTGQPWTGLEDEALDDWQKVFAVNVVAPLRLARQFVGHLERSERKLVVNISSRMGSIAGTSGGGYLYRASKAALNMVSRTLAEDLKPSGITVVAVHPGWVKTEIGGPDAPTAPAEAAGHLLSLIQRLNRDQNGRFLNYDGQEIPW